MRAVAVRALATAFMSAIFLASPVAPAPAQIPGATNEPPVGRELPNLHRGIPFGLKVALALLVLLALAAAFYFALRAWRSSNLFHREYRFPVPKNVAVRLGASRSGGGMATADFAANAPGESSSTNQRPEETPLQ